MTARGRRRGDRWTKAHVRRVFWRAGFGATAAEQAKWARRGKKATIEWLVDGDGPARLVGPEPSADGVGLDRFNEYGHDVLWWVDRMVRTTQPLEEKMTLFWHDHFATRGITIPLALRQNDTLRAHALGRFDVLLHEITLDPAMQLFLTLAGSHKDAPNENFARELLELFTIGKGYTEKDVREASRALTGFVEVRENGQTTGVRIDPERHDPGRKKVLGHAGRHDWTDVLRLCVHHPRHAPFLVGKLWDFFVGTKLDAPTRKALVRSYRRSGRSLRPVIRRILAHPDLYRRLDRPDMVKWPAVLVAGQLRAMGAPVDRRHYVHLMSSMGQTLFEPPSVAGWDWGPLWLSSNAMRARFDLANAIITHGGPGAVAEDTLRPGLSAAAHVRLAKRAVGRPDVTKSTELVLTRLAKDFLSRPEATSPSEEARRYNARDLQRALRHLLISGPDNQLC